MTRTLPRLLTGLVALALATTSAHAFNISYTTSGMDAEQTTALQSAINTIDSQFTDPITVSLSFSFNNNFASSATIGQTVYSLYSESFSNTVAAMKTDQGSGSVLNALLNSNSFHATTNSNATVNSSAVWMTTANAKALGSFNDIPTNQTDATITFNSSFSFAYTPAELNSNTVDFTTVVEHEILHALGFASAVDYIGATGQSTISPTTLDLFRFADSTLAGSGAINGSTTRDLTVGSADSFYNGVTFYELSTGVNGDGNQASHWKDQTNQSQYIGIMDPTLPRGQTEGITAADLSAMDLIGYNLAPVPEPASLLTLAFGALLLHKRRRSHA